LWNSPYQLANTFRDRVQALEASLGQQPAVAVDVNAPLRPVTARAKKLAPARPMKPISSSVTGTIIAVASQIIATSTSETDLRLPNSLPTTPAPTVSRDLVH
jgi:hypothetical protein